MEKEKIKLCLAKLKISEEWLDLLCEKLNKYGIVNDEDVKVFLAQTAHESANYKRLEESFKYKPQVLYTLFSKYIKSLEEAEELLKKGSKAVADKIYGGRMGNSREEGYTYRGRGIIQLTGKENYTTYNNLIDIPDVDILANPELAKRKDVAVEIACCYYKHRGCIGKDIYKTTPLINGANIGLKERVKNYNLIKEL